MQIELPDDVTHIIEVLEAAGEEAYAVGGCVRDSLLGREPDDWDITTSAPPDKVKTLFGHTIDTGIAHGTVTVMIRRRGYEVTTYRIDGRYEDGRHPAEVTFTPNLTEDLRRRDFTINAMAYNARQGLVDCFGGAKDLEAGLIRCVGSPMERFSEDALRIMRAIRFSAQLGYRIYEETRDAIISLAASLTAISAERIRVELTKLLISPHPEYLQAAYELGVTAVILPEFDRIMAAPQAELSRFDSLGDCTLRSLQEVPPEPVLRLAVLLHGVDSPENRGDTARRILRRLKFDNHTISRVVRLVAFHDDGNDAEPDSCLLRHSMYRLGEEAFPDLFILRRAVVIGQNAPQQQEKLERIRQWQELYNQICQDGDCVSLKTLALTGSDLIALGMKPGREIGETLEQLLELVLDHPEYNTREYLLARMKNSYCSLRDQ